MDAGTMSRTKVKPKKKRLVKHYRWQHVQTDHPLEEAFIKSLTEGLELADNIFQLMNGINKWLAQAAYIDMKHSPKRIIVPGQEVPADLGDSRH